MRSARLTFRTATLPLAGVAISLSQGCMVGPDYRPPELETPDAWHSTLMEGMDIAEDGVGAWWHDFDDPVLVELIRRTDRNNLELRMMVARIDAARAAYGIAGSALFPQIDGNGQVIWSRGNDEFSGNGGNLSDFSSTSSNENFSTGLEMSWELDLWGRVRRTMNAREFDVLASLENWRDMLVTVRAEVASAYIDYRTNRARVELIELAIAATRLAVSIVEEEYAAGTIALSDVLSARFELRTFESRLPPLEAAATASLNQLSILLGETPGALEELVGDAGTIPVPPAAIAVAMPADVIRQRPDIRAAERTLASAVETIGATEALLLPQFTLNGGIGFQSSSAGDLFTLSTRYWTVGPAFNWSLLNWGAIRNQIRQQNAVTDEALLRYQSTVLGAFQDVENSLVGFASSELARRDTAIARDDNLQALVLATQAYDAGTVDLTSVVQIELQYLDAENALIDLEGQVALSAVTLYKSMGGDWTPVVPGDDGPQGLDPAANSVATADGGEDQ